MIHFANLCAALPGDKTALETFRARSSGDDYATALALLTGQRPRRIAPLDTILHWVAATAGISDALLTACTAVTRDRAETAALLLPPAIGTPPSLTQTIAILAQATPLTAHNTLQTLWQTLPPPANTILFRLAAGRFRQTLPKAAPLTNQPPRTLRAVMTL
ncbi:MAG: hypothetical protein WCS20_07205, partial [Alphaproteobacteria bacterium]